MSFALQTVERFTHPVDIIEHIAMVRDWSYERSAEDEINISISGSWTDYHVSISWHDDLESLHLACVFDMRVPGQRESEMCRLIGRINEQLWLGHFDLWSHEGALMFRHGLLFTGGIEPTADQCEAMLQLAVDSCERYFQSFQFVLWGGMSASQSLETALFETAGRA